MLLVQTSVRDHWYIANVICIYIYFKIASIKVFLKFNSEFLRRLLSFLSCESVPFSARFGVQG